MVDREVDTGEVWVSREEGFERGVRPAARPGEPEAEFLQGGEAAGGEVGPERCEVKLENPGDVQPGEVGEG